MNKKFTFTNESPDDIIEIERFGYEYSSALNAYTIHEGVKYLYSPAALLRLRSHTMHRTNSMRYYNVETDDREIADEYPIIHVDNLKIMNDFLVEIYTSALKKAGIHFRVHSFDLKNSNKLNTISYEKELSDDDAFKMHAANLIVESSTIIAFDSELLELIARIDSFFDRRNHKERMNFESLSPLRFSSFSRVVYEERISNILSIYGLQNIYTHSLVYSPVRETNSIAIMKSFNQRNQLVHRFSQTKAPALSYELKTLYIQNDERMEDVKTLCISANRYDTINILYRLLNDLNGIANISIRSIGINIWVIDQYIDESSKQRIGSIDLENNIYYTHIHYESLVQVESSSKYYSVDINVKDVEIHNLLPYDCSYHSCYIIDRYSTYVTIRFQISKSEQEDQIRKYYLNQDLIYIDDAAA